MQVVIIGAGVAGLATAYGLVGVPNVKVRVLEQRKKEQTVGAGYPLHLSPDGRDALLKLLTPEDYLLLLQARTAYPISHDGVTMLRANGRVSWRMVQSPGEKCYMERRDLMKILQGGLERRLQENQSGKSGNTKVMTVDYGKTVKSAHKMDDEVGWRVETADGEVIKCDLLIGADGMFSSIRKMLYPQDDQSGPEALPWSIINLRATSSEVRKWVHDEEGMNMIYGKGWSCVLLPLSTGLPHAGNGCSTISSDTGALQCSAIDTRQNDPPSALASPSTTLYDEPTIALNVADQVTYVALTIPLPLGSLRDTLQSLPGAKSSGSFICDLLAESELDNARVFPLWTSRTTVVAHDDGHEMAVLIGDASHGMVPFCGAGASAAISDAVDLVCAIQNHTIFGGNLDMLLSEMAARQRKRNDPLIKQSRMLLELCQADTAVRRVMRGVAFGALELKEKVGKERAKTLALLLEWK